MTNEQNNLPDIIQTITVQAPIRKVWKYVSTADGISEWLMPCDFKAEEGYEFTIQSPFGASPCKVLEVNEPNKISIQWDVDGWILTFLLKEVGEETEFTLIHGGWKNAEDIITKANQPQAVIRGIMANGWAGIIGQKFKQVVEG